MRARARRAATAALALSMSLAAGACRTAETPATATAAATPAGAADAAQREGASAPETSAANAVPDATAIATNAVAPSIASLASGGGLAPAATGSAAPDCAATAGDRTHCVWLVLSGPARKRAADVAQRLTDAGFPAEAAGEKVTGWWTVAEIETFFAAKVSWAVTGASASDRLVCQAVIPDVAVPLAWRKDVVAAKVDDPVCEM